MKTLSKVDQFDKTIFEPQCGLSKQSHLKTIRLGSNFRHIMTHIVPIDVHVYTGIVSFMCYSLSHCC